MDRLTKEQRSRNMSRIKSRDTSIEKTVRQYLTQRGYRYRIHFDAPGHPDIAFPRFKIAIFINGCFWHNHGCALSSIPKSNVSYWQEKLARNSRRDEDNMKKLILLGWNVEIIWECQLKISPEQELKRTSERLRVLMMKSA